MFFHKSLAYRRLGPRLRVFYHDDQNFNWDNHRSEKIQLQTQVGCLSIVKVFACLFVTFESFGLNSSIDSLELEDLLLSNDLTLRSILLDMLYLKYTGMYVVNIGWNIFRNQLSPLSTTSFRNWVLVSVSISTMYIIFVGGNIQSLGK